MKMIIRIINYKKQLQFLSICHAIFFMVGCAVDRCMICKGDQMQISNIQSKILHDWEDLYQCAQYHIEHHCYENAERLLKKALTQRAKDQWMARVYGMHFSDYFPNRELGICYYFMKNDDQATKYLNISIHQQPTMKAWIYLNYVKKRLLQQQGLNISKPTIHLNFHGEKWTNDFPVTISGTVYDQQYVHQIQINQMNIPIEGAMKKISFNKKLYLNDGSHLIHIKAQNLLGGTSEKSFIVHIDRSGPVIIIKNYKSGERLIGQLMDKSKEYQLFVNDTQIEVLSGKMVDFEYLIPPHIRDINILAIDKPGNKTFAFLNDHYLQTANSLHMFNAYWVAGYGTVKKSQLYHSKPYIQVYGWPEISSVFLDHFFLEGFIHGKHDILSYSINHQKMSIIKGSDIFFSHIMKLQPGQNEFYINACDTANHQSEKTIRVLYEIPKVNQQKNRIKLRLFQFDQINNRQLSDSFFHLLTKSIHQCNRFNIITENYHRQSDEKEIFETSFDNEEPSDIALLGSLHKSNNAIQIIARLVKIQNAMIVKVFSIQDVYSENESFTNLADLAETLAQKIHMAFPLMDGAFVFQNNQSGVITPEIWKPEKGLIFNGAIVYLYYDDIPRVNPVTHRFLGSDTIIEGTGLISQQNKTGTYEASMNNSISIKHGKAYRMMTR